MTSFSHETLRGLNREGERMWAIGSPRASMVGIFFSCLECTSRGGPPITFEPINSALKGTLIFFSFLVLMGLFNGYLDIFIKMVVP